ncbi:MAG TPA: hypothetical protein VHW01_30010 [Polyangiaceae bacterium]|jgi:hypothetical protein|nr:hypothetical protein [Polyangiaceae bacterium]
MFEAQQALRLLAAIAVCAACGKAPSDTKASSALDPIPSAKPVERGAVGDSDLRIMLTELASAKACELVRGQFRPLRAPDRPAVVTGILWVRECKISNVGTKVTVALSGNGWQWAAQQEHKAGGSFAIRQYVKFAMTATIPGALDMAYAPNDHIVSLWFTPAKEPEVTFTPLGNIEVDRKGLWSSVVGAVASVFGQSPEHMAQGEAKDQGGHELEKQLADGLSITINLCTGLSRFHLGREPKGTLNKPDAGESKRVPVELQPSALMVFGPQPVGDGGFTANIDAPTGSVHFALACADEVDALAAAYVTGQPLPSLKTLAAKDVQGKGTLAIRKASCPVALVAQELDPNVRDGAFDWQRPIAQTARSTGGPIIECSGK